MKPTIWRKLSASFLMLLFLAVLGAKAIHTHHTEQSKVEGVVLSAPSGTCDICAFQLGRDAELPGQVLISSAFEYAIYPSPAPETVFIDTHFHVHAERGPPAV